MKILQILIFAACLSLVSVTAEAAKRRRAPTYYPLKYNSLVGIHVFEGASALAMGGQLGYAPSKKSHIYIGPEFNFSHFGNSTLLCLLGSIWKEWDIFDSDTLRLVTGLLVGPGFSDGIVGTANETLISFLELAFVQDVNSLVSVRGQFRPGFVGQRFTFMMNLNIAFRFRKTFF